MKNLILISLFAGAMAMAACTSNPKNNVEEATTEEGHHHHDAEAIDTTAATASYICPMKCEGSASNKPGKCPVCKMDLVAVEETPAENK